MEIPGVAKNGYIDQKGKMGEWTWGGKTKMDKHYK